METQCSRSYLSPSQRHSPRSPSLHPSSSIPRSPDSAKVEDQRRFQLCLVDHGISPVSPNATITGLKFFFEVTLERADLMARMHTVRAPRTLPVVLSRDQAARLIACAGIRRFAATGRVLSGLALIHLFTMQAKAAGFRADIFRTTP